MNKVITTNVDFCIEKVRHSKLSLSRSAQNTLIIEIQENKKKITFSLDKTDEVMLLSYLQEREGE